MRLIIVYALAAGAALGTAMFGANVHNDLLVRAGGTIATILTAVVVAVTTWYRRDNVVDAAILLGLAWTLARVVGVCCGTLLLRRTFDGVGFVLLGVLFGLPIAILEAIFIGGVLVAVLRRIRPRSSTPTLQDSGPDPS